MDTFPIGQGFTTQSVDPAALVEVPETATYHDATKTVFRFYRAGTMVSRQEAEAMGMLPVVETGVLEEEPEAKAAPAPANKMESAPKNKKVG